MRLICRKNGFSLVETLVVVSVIAVLVSVVIGVGKHVKEQGKIKLTKSTIDILVTALELYHQDQGDMPFLTRRETTAGSGTYIDLAINEPFLESDFALLFDPAATIVINNGSHVDDDWSCEAMHYYLSKSINSRRIVNMINNQLVTSRDLVGQVLNINIEVLPGPIVLVGNQDMPRVVDAWGNALRYRYTAGNTFCVVVSAGEDKTFGTADDISNTN